MCNVLIYSRVSTESQKTDRQIHDLAALAKSKQWNIVKTMSESISGASTMTSRQSNTKLLEYINSGRIDKILITEISRLGRRVSDAINFIEYLTEHGVSLYIQNLGMETLQENGKPNFMFKPILVTLASYAEMERDLLSERIRSGMNTAKANGKHLGRPKGHLKKENAYLRDYKKLIDDFDKGLSLRKLSKIHGVSINTIRKVKSMTM
jgi:DNA invertase Pin-like site-specific DNA recombinase